MLISVGLAASGIWPVMYTSPLFTAGPPGVVVVVVVVASEVVGEGVVDVEGVDDDDDNELVGVGFSVGLVLGVVCEILSVGDVV